MTTQDLKESQVAVIFFTDGTMAMCRGIIDTTDYNKVKQIFIVPDNTPVYKLSNYWGYHDIDEKWKEVK